MTEMTQPTIGKLDIDVNKGAGMDPAMAALLARGNDGGFGGNGMNGIFGLAALGLVFGRGNGLFGGNGDGAAAAMAAGSSAKDATFESTLSLTNAINASTLAGINSAHQNAEAICDVKSTVASTTALVQGAVDAVGLESCRQFGALSTSLAIQNGTTRTEAVATEARLSASIYQQANAAAMQVAQGFNQVERGQDQLQRSIQETACDTQKQLAECCCEMRSGIKDVQTGILMSESRLAAQATANTQRIVDLITSEKINALETENSNLRQSSTIRDALDRQLNVILAHFHPTTASAAVAAAR